MRKLSAYGAGALAVVLLATLGIRWLSDATLTVHDPVPGDTRMELVVDVHRSGGMLRSQSTAEMADALVQQCRLLTLSDVEGTVEDLGDNRYRAVMVPAMNDARRRIFRGCLEDWTIDRIRGEVVHMVDLPTVGEDDEEAGFGPPGTGGNETGRT